MDIRKLAAICLAAVLAAAILVPIPALATNSANAEYPSDGTTPETSGQNDQPAGNVTRLTLVAQDLDANLASNGGSAWVAQHAKVQVPVAINFVVSGAGDITGPNAAAITNYSSYPVSVSSIKAVPVSNSVTFAASPSAAAAADQVYLQFKPGASATAVNLSQFTGASGAAPTAGEWNIGAGAALSLQDFSGKIGGFSTINPLSQAEFGHIEWTIKAGTADLPAALPETLGAASASDLQAAGDAIRGGHATVKSHYDTLVGQTISTTIGNGSGGTQTVAARLVDVSYDRGLVFMFEQPIATQRMNADNTNVGGWVDTELRASLNSGSLYTGYLQSMKIGEVNVTPATVTNNSLDYNGGNLRNITSEDKYWLPSASEIFGGFVKPRYDDRGVEIGEQFAYCRTQGFVPGAACYALVRGYGMLWLRSAGPGDDHGFLCINDNETTQWDDPDQDGFSASYASEKARCKVRPCFAL